MRWWLHALSSTRFNSMNARVRQVLDEVLLMPAEDRALIAQELNASLDDSEDGAKPDEIEKAWAEEIERRVANVLEGRSKGRPAAEALAEVRARLQAARAR